MLPVYFLVPAQKLGSLTNARDSPPYPSSVPSAFRHRISVLAYPHTSPWFPVALLQPW